MLANFASGALALLFGRLRDINPGELFFLLFAGTYFRKEVAASRSSCLAIIEVGLIIEITQ